MKKNAFLSCLLCFALLLQCTVIPAHAEAIPVTTEAAETQETATEETAAAQSLSLPYGQACIQNGCRTIEGMVPLDGSERKLDTALGVFVYETTTNTVVYSYNPDMKIAPGSLTKIVTALLAIELCEMDEVVTVNTSNISKLPSGALNQNIKNGEQLTVEDLVYCMLLQSANDAAIVLAEHISGNLQGFVTLMNARVKQMGCTNTQFENVHGLDNATNYTTARDMTKIVSEAVKNETFKEVFGATSYTVPETEKSAARSFKTTNYFLDDSVITQYYDERVTGGVQSYVSQGSGASMVVTAQSAKKTDEEASKAANNMNLICVVLGCTREFASNGWQPTYYGNFDEMTDLIDYVLNNFKLNRILYEGQALNQFSVADGECQAVGQPNVNYNTVLKADCQMDNLYMEYSVIGGGLSAPVSKGEKIATVAVKYRNCVVAEAELYAMGDVQTLSSRADIQGLETQNRSGSGILNILGTVCMVILGLMAAYLGINAWRRSQAKARRRRRRAARRRSN